MARPTRPVQLSAEERTVLEALRHEPTNTLVDPANEPAYIRTGYGRVDIPVEGGRGLGWSIAGTLSGYGFLECVQRGDPCIYQINSAGAAYLLREPAPAPAPAPVQEPLI